MALALDGSVTGNSAAASSLAVTLTTTAAGVVIVCVTTNGGPVTSITNTAGLSWALRKRADTGNTNFTIEEWYAISSGALSSDQITVNTNSIGYLTVTAFGVSGANNVSPFDTNAAIPAGASGAPSALVPLTTDNANDFLLAAYRFISTASPTAGSGWTTISGSNFMLVEYQIVSATQSAANATITTGNGDQGGGVADAIVQASGGDTLFAQSVM